LPRNLGVGDIFSQRGTLQRSDEEELHCRHALLDRVGSQLLIAQQMKLKLAHMFWPKLVRGPMEIFRELPQSSRVGFYSSLGIITTLEFLQQHFAKLGHREPPCNPTLSCLRPQCPTNNTRSVRRASGLVQTAFREIIPVKSPSHQTNTSWPHKRQTPAASF
jgi:hypothetical protein